MVNVSFDLVGNPTKDETTGKLKVFTAIRCFDIEIIRRAGEQMKVTQQPAATSAPAPAQEMRGVDPAAMPQPATPPIDPVTGETPKDDGLPF